MYLDFITVPTIAFKNQKKKKNIDKRPTLKDFIIIIFQQQDVSYLMYAFLLIIPNIGVCTGTIYFTLTSTHTLLKMATNIRINKFLACKKKSEVRNLRYPNKNIVLQFMIGYSDMQTIHILSFQINLFCFVFFLFILILLFISNLNKSDNDIFSFIVHDSLPIFHQLDIRNSLVLARRTEQATQNAERL